MKRSAPGPQTKGGYAPGGGILSGTGIDLVQRGLYLEGLRGVMKALIKKTLRSMVESVPLSVYQFLVRRQALVLLYHVVSDRPVYHIKHLYAYKSAEMFEADLIYLKQNHNLISYEQLVEHHSLKPGSVLVAFDDGYSECFSVVRPLLLRHQIPGNFFIMTDFIDNGKMFFRNKISLCIERIMSSKDLSLAEIFDKTNSAFRQSIKSPASLVGWLKSLHASDEDVIDKVCGMLGIDIEEYLATHKPYLTSEEIKHMVSDGFTLGAHSRKHPQLGLLSSDEIEEEIVGSCRKMADLTGKGDIPFAFPFHGNGIDRSFLESLRAKNKFIGLLFDSTGLKKDKNFIINRISTDSPLGGVGSKSNIPLLLRYAYVTYTLSTFLRR
jgi:peptidoglycan/xylan/chitin deacetylase (PgdA/CDA1 family)